MFLALLVLREAFFFLAFTSPFRAVFYWDVINLTLSMVQLDFGFVFLFLFF